jgi:hypothetical protein
MLDWACTTRLLPWFLPVSLVGACSDVARHASVAFTEAAPATLFAPAQPLDGNALSGARSCPPATRLCAKYALAATPLASMRLPIGGEARLA